MAAIVAAALNNNNVCTVLHHRRAFKIAILSSLLLGNICAADAVIAGGTAQAKSEQDGVVYLFCLDALIIDQYSRVRCAKAVNNQLFGVHYQ